MFSPARSFAFACLAPLLARWLPSCGDDVGAPCTGEACSDEGAVEACYDGPPTTRNVGPCTEGRRECKDGWWGECVGDVGPLDETCDDDLDNDCNGTVDDGCPCLSGQVRDCYEGPSTARGIGICVAGERACVNELWSTSCEGQVLPLEGDSCNGLDDDCNGATDEACICTLAGSYCDEEGNPVPCPAGSYQSEPGQPSCIELGPGAYVDQPGATAPTPCPEGGYYCPSAANAAPSNCPAGSYTNTNGAAGASTCTECPSGSYCTGNGARRDCSDGMGAPPGSTGSDDCGCHVRLTICEADCSNWPSGCAYGSTQWMEGFGPGDFFCIPDTDWGHGRESLDCEY